MDKEKKAENEVKLLGGFNNQLKYSDHSVKDTMEKIEVLLSILKIEKVGEVKKRNQRDEYYDTYDQKIKNKKGSARIRQITTNSSSQSSYLVTVKKKISTGIGICEDALVRDEYEFQCDNYNECEKLLYRQARNLFEISNDVNIERQISVYNQRNYCIIKTKIATYELAYDKFKYVNPKDNSQSHYFYEIEIETNDETVDIKKDEQIDALVKVFKEVMGFEHDGKSKYRRGIEWKTGQDGLERKIFIVFDIVNYSRESSKTQKKKVECFIRIVKKCLLNNLESVQKIPLGDGLILVFPDTYNSFSFLNNLFANLNTVNRNRGERENIRIRTSIHVGSVIRYFDINENCNFAGHGINVAYGINNKAQDGQVLVSKEFYDFMRDKDLLEENNYKKIGLVEIKHDVRIEVYNYYDSNMLVGKEV